MPRGIGMRLTRAHALQILGLNVSVSLLGIDDSPESVCDVCGPAESATRRKQRLQ